MLRRGWELLCRAFGLLVQMLRNWWKLLCGISYSVAKTPKRWWNAYVFARSIVAILLPLFLGIAFAAGHHFFYVGLHDKPIPTDDISNVFKLRLSRQQYNIAVGNTFAFLVKNCLSVSVGIAYLQLLWHSILRLPHTISAIDTLFSTLSNLTSFGSLRVWWRHPVLLLMTLTVWLSPIQSIITPATLTVQNKQVQPVPTRLIDVPRIDFASSNFQEMRCDDEGEICGPCPPKLYVQNLVTLTSLLQSTLPFDAPGPNATWSVSFPGPSLNCSPVEPYMYQAIIANVWQLVAYEGIGEPYVSWVPRGDSLADSVPFPFFHNLTEIAFPHFANVTLDLPQGSFINRSDSVGPRSNISTVWKKPATLYIALFPGLIIRGNHRYSPSESFDNATIIQYGMAYQSIMDAFGAPLVGLATGTGVRASPLALTREMGFLKSTTAETTNVSLQNLVEELFKNVTVNAMNTEALRVNYSQLPNVSNQYYFQNGLSAFPNIPPLTEVSFPTYYNTYVYSASKLLTAYGIPIVFSTLCAVAGLATLISTKSYYTGDFSTVLRTTRAAELAVAIDSVDTQGRSPLPKYLSGAKLSFEVQKREGVVYKTVKDTSARSESLLSNIERVTSDGDASLAEW